MSCRAQTDGALSIGRQEQMGTINASFMLYADGERRVRVFFRRVKQSTTRRTYPRTGAKAPRPRPVVFLLRVGQFHHRLRLVKLHGDRHASINGACTQDTKRKLSPSAPRQHTAHKMGYLDERNAKGFRF